MQGHLSKMTNLSGALSFCVRYSYNDNTYFEIFFSKDYLLLRKTEFEQSKDLFEIKFENDTISDKVVNNLITNTAFAAIDEIESIDKRFIKLFYDVSTLGQKPKIFENVFLLKFFHDYLIIELQVTNEAKEELNKLKAIFEKSNLGSILLLRIKIHEYFIRQSQDNMILTQYKSILQEYKSKILSDQYFSIVHVHDIAKRRITWLPQFNNELNLINRYESICI